MGTIIFIGQPTTPTLNFYDEGGGTITGDYDLTNDTEPGATLGPHTLLNTNPLVGSLGSYGGPTETQPLLPGSPAIDAGSNALAVDANSNLLATDQRGVARIANGTVDIGAYESRGFTIAVSGGDGQNGLTSESFSQPLVASVSSANGDPVAGGTVTFAGPGSGASGTGATVTIGADGTASDGFVANSTAGSYNVTASTTGEINPATFALTNVSLSFSSTNLVYNGNPQSINYTVSSVGVSYTAIYSQNGVTLSGPPTNAGDYQLSIAIPGTQSPNAGLISENATFTISQAVPILNLTDASASYNGSPFQATATVAGVATSGPNQDSTPASSLEGVAPTLTYYSANEALSGAPTQAGTYTVVETFPGSTDYAASNAIRPVVDFGGSNGVQPVFGSLIEDSSGDLFGTTAYGGDDNDGTVFELVNNGGTYTRNTLFNFNGTDGDSVFGGLVMDRSGNLFGTTETGGADGDGTVFELINSSNTYTFSTLASFNGANGSNPYGTLTLDSSGDLFSTTPLGGTADGGTVFELVDNNNIYTLNTLVSFDGTSGYEPFGGVVEDGSGNLFGTTELGGPGDDGTVFELVDNGGHYTLNPLVNFDGTNGSEPLSGLLEDSSGNLFGDTLIGGATNEGTIFELVNSNNTYTLNTLASFNITNGAEPVGSLIEDSSGNLFGAADLGGTDSSGTVFELVNSNNTYTLNTLGSFNGTNGSGPLGGLFEDSNGNLFGTTDGGGPNGAGTVFEIARTATTFTIAQATPTINVSDAGGTYKGTAYAATATIAGIDNTPGATLENVGLTLDYYDTDTQTDLGSTAPSSAGHYRVTASFAGSTDYALHSNSADFTVGQAKSTTTVGDTGGTYSGTAFPATSATATGAGGLDDTNLRDFTFSYVGTGSTSYGPSASAPVNVGAYAVTATYGGDANHTPSTGTMPFTIAKLTATIAASAGATVVVGTGTKLTASATLTGSNLTGSITFTLYGPSGNVVDTEAASVAGTGIYATPSGYLPGAAGTYQWVASYGAGNNSFVSTTMGAAPEVAVGPGATLVGNTVYLVGGNAGDRLQINPIGRSNTGSTGIQVQGQLNGANIKSVTYNPAPAVIDIVGFNGNDSINMGGNLAIPAVVSEGNGNDTIQLGNSNNSVTVGSGYDQFQAGDGNNTIVANTGFGAVYVNLGNGNNTVTVADTPRGSVLVQAGNGGNQVTVGSGNDQIELGLDGCCGGSCGSQPQASTNTVIAGSGNDRVQLGDGNNVVTVGSGNDVILLGDGNNTVTAGNGNNCLQAGDGNNIVVVGSGSDNISVGNGSNVVQAGAGNDNIQAGNGNNLIVGGLGHDNIQVGRGNNILIDGSVQLTQAGDTLEKVLSDWTSDIRHGDSVAQIAALIRPRLHVTDNTTSANTLVAGNGLDWFWDTYAHDHTDRNAADLLN